MLLPARKSPALVPLYAAYGRRLLRRAFARVRLGGAPWPGVGPTIAFPNHSAWWDPVVLTFLSHDVFRADAWGLMQGAQLRRYPFFRQLGCFGTIGDDPGDARAVREHALALLGGAPDRTLWLFPQGALLPARRPPAFRSGLARLGRALPGARLVPVAIRYEHRTEQRPELFVRVGAPLHAAADEGAAALTRRLERALAGELARLDADLLEEAPHGYAPVLEGRGASRAFWERAAGRLSADRSPNR